MHKLVVKKIWMSTLVIISSGNRKCGGKFCHEAHVVTCGPQAGKAPGQIIEMSSRC